ncbi:MAG: TIGR01777 family protein [Lentisphaerae bacterium]|nr:TIGR01777 family protein [Lentisphaerota bacterium]
MKVALTGSGGLIGSAISADLAAAGHAIVRMVRGTPREGEVRWDPGAPCDLSALDGVDAVIHLAGENVGAGRWTPARRIAIRASRVDGTRNLVASLLRMRRPPRVLLAASAIGWYGDRGDAPVDESAPAGDSFFGRLVADWEAELAPARAAGIRTVAMRFGVVLARGGGALARMLPPFRLGLGGPLGSGRQVMSWIALDDVVAAVRFLLAADNVAGPVNLTAPAAVTNREFAATLGRVLRRPAVLPAPAFALRLLLGREMADELLLSGARVVPARLLAAGFRFAHPDPEPALRRMLL